MRTCEEENGIAKEGHSSSVSSSNRLVRFHTCKKSDGLVHCSVENAAVLYEEVTQI